MRFEIKLLAVFDEKKADEKRKKIKKVRKEETKVAAEGETYGPGVAPLS